MSAEPTSLKSVESRPVRPEFAEAVYGTTNHPQQQQTSIAKSCNQTSEMCSALLRVESTRWSELAELYTYSEMDEFALNFECFGRYLRERKKEPIWDDLPAKEKSNILQNIVESFENSDSEHRLEAARIILYILQGAYGDFTDIEAKDSDRWSTEAICANSATEEDSDGKGLNAAPKWFGKDNGTGGFEQDCLVRSALNAYQVYEHGLFQPLCSLLRLEDNLPFERHADHSRQSSVSNSRSASHMDLANSSDGPGGGGTSGSASGTLEHRRSRRSATLADNERIRVSINCIYHIVEAIRREDLLEKIEEYSRSSGMFCLPEIQHHPNVSSKYSMDRLRSLRQQFLTELEEPMENKETLLVHLLEMMPSFILLLCWKVLLATLGGIDFLRDQKAMKRTQAGLSPVADTVHVANKMKPLLNCDGTVAAGGILGLNTAIAGGGEKAEQDAGTITGQLGRKLRSIHHQVRPFNRQVACSSSSDQAIPMTHNGPYHHERNNVFSRDTEGGGGETKLARRLLGRRRKMRNLNLWRRRKVVHCSTKCWKNFPRQQTRKRGGNEKQSQIKITLSTGETRAQSLSVDHGKRRPEELQLLLIDQPHESLTATNKNRGNDVVINADGGDQTPKACESPAKLNSLWPPPPPTGLPWRPKVRESDIENFLQTQRKKHFNFQLPPGDSITVFALPEPIVKGSLAALRRNLYVPLSELQLKTEDRYNRYPFSQKEFVEDCPAERLYVRILPGMTEYVIALLKVILASLPSSKAKIDAVTILSDVLTPETDTNEVLSNSISLDLANFSHTNVLEETVRVAIDINRHKELIIKAASAILILLLKHLRLNHVFQFENFARYLVLANCLPLSKHELIPFNYPQCALFFVRNGNEWPQLTADNVDGCGGASESPSYFLWRQAGTHPNVGRLQIGARAEALHASEAGYLPTIRAETAENASPLFGHRLNDDWAYANEVMRTKSIDSQQEENELGMAIRRFNARRYPHIYRDGAESHGGGGREGDEQQQAGVSSAAVELAKVSLLDDWDPKEWEPMDNSLQSALAWEPQFSERFTQNYEQWLEEEGIVGHLLLSV
uniref:Uncharacterized protein n=1 Tax=Globodera rostochiensis TaxID=31243 RepID=A0A914I6C7_GLORO